MIVSVLGPLEVDGDGRRVGGGRLRALLARLALDAGKPVTTGRLVDAVWEEEPPGDQAHALQSLVSRLRRALGDGHLTATPGGYKLDAEVDAQRFEELAAEGHAALTRREYERAARVLREALGLWRGPALADLGDYRFAVAAAARLDDLKLTATADRAAADLALGRGERLVGELEELCGEHPLHERLAAQLIAALYAAGRQADALATYERVRSTLSDELGVPPGPELQQAHMAVLQAQPRPTVRSNLPAEVTSFVGREREIEQIGELLERSRLVTLVGPGGAGKTRLARETVARRVERVPDGVWMVELAPVTSEAEIVPAVLGALGAREAMLSDRPRGPRDSIERLLDVLADRDMILVLDNCEHLIAAVAELVDRLLASAPQLRVVATSREALAIAGEAIAAVPPLGLPVPGVSAEVALAHPAIRLFADRAAAAQPGFTVDDDTVTPVVEVCRRLDGLPLALELAAARLRTLPLTELAERLDDRFRLLTGGSRTALPRHRTLRAVVDWSWELLTEDEQALAAKLSVFAAGATAESAVAVGGDFEGLVALVDRSLLQVVSGTSRYRMLETIREYGLERLEEAGELESTRGAHARYFTELVETAEPCLRRPGQKKWFALLQAERENILAALRWLGDSGDARGAMHLAVSLLWFWMLEGSQNEFTTWTSFALDVEGEADPDEVAIAQGLRDLAELSEAGDPEAMKQRIGEVAARVAGIDDTARPLVALAKPIMAMFTGDEAGGRAAEESAANHPDPWVRAAMHLLNAGRSENDGEVAAMGGELAAAREEFAAVGDSWGLGMALFIESGRLIVEGDLAAARDALDGALEALGDLNPEIGDGMLEFRLADIRLRLGDVEGAREAARKALDRRDLGRDDTAFAQAMVAGIECFAGNLEVARRELADARARLERKPASLPEQGHGQALIEAQSALVEAALGDLEAAERHVAAGHAAAVATSDMPVVASVGVAAAGVAKAQGRLDEAAELLGAAAAIRGADDFSNPMVVRIRDDARAAAYARGRALSREDALGRLAAEASRPAPVGP